MMKSLAMAAAAFAASAAASELRTGASDYDYFMLVMQYAPALCQDGTYSCNADWSFMTMHGLWPERNDGSYPSNCGGSFNPNGVNSIKNELDTYWPSLNGPNDSFWQHEYEKHGTCATDVFPTEFDFFNGTLALRAKYETVKALAKAGITPGGSSFTKAALRSALTNAYGAYGTITCDSQGYLTGVTMCISKKLKAIACQGISDSCSSSSLTLVAPAMELSPEELALVKPAKRALRA